MIEFVVRPMEVILRYQSEQAGNAWVWQELKDHGTVTLSRVFHFERQDLVEEPDEADREHDFEAFEHDFRFATRRDGYFHVSGRIFDIPNPVLIADQGLRLERKLFVAERNISIFRRISKLVGPNQAIVVGGDREGAIPFDDFRELMRKFPNTTELDRYASAGWRRWSGTIFLRSRTRGSSTRTI